ncbi:PTS sugar transporter subunit IIA [Streptomyces rimosus]|uniref:PTS sugar transporter subunit IIA n=1 Tax=Streptomyces rimosus TaxID=1927 RepID=UPI00099C3933|nr:PTS sugar transporter subunit IIA [Streptomyces rimosus]
MTSHPQTRPQSTTPLADYLPKQRIHLHAQVNTKGEALQLLTRGLHTADAVAAPRAARIRLPQGTNGFHGIAILPIRSRMLDAPAAAFARIPPHLSWQGTDHHPIRDVFLLVVPQTLMNTDCLQAYSTLARHTAHAGFRRMLAAARTIDELYELFGLIR